LISPKGRIAAVLFPGTLAVFLLGSPARLAARVVTDQTGRKVNIPDHPHRIISLAPSITETVYALGMGDALVGDTTYCDYPPEAKLKPHVGDTLNPSLEKIIDLKPDLVLGTAEANRRQTADQLQELGIPLYGLTAHNLEETLHSIEDLGTVLGQGAEAQSLVEQLQARVSAVENRVKGKPRPKVLVVVWYQPLITAGPGTFISDVISRAGGISLGDTLAGEWPHLGMEDVIAQEPDVILFPKTDAKSPSLPDFRSMRAWRDLRAVKDGQLYFVSETIERPSPRIVDALEETARALHPKAFGASGEKP
jgi:cobalamin transport system substrate-binding protein